MRDNALWRWGRGVRYALPGWVGARLPGPDVAWAIGAARAHAAAGRAVTFGYFQGAGEGPDDILQANLARIAALRTGPPYDALLALKAPPLGFDPARLGQIADAAGEVGGEVGLMLDAHAPHHAKASLAALLALPPGTGIALPARWRRSVQDAQALRAGPARIRLVKGEWADDAGDVSDVGGAYLALARALAGRAAPVAVASHDAALAGAALRLLRDAGTPVELELLRALPARQAMRAASALGVRVRVYLPFGPGWWPYAIDKALARPYLLAWYLKDRFG